MSSQPAGYDLTLLDQLNDHPRHSPSTQSLPPPRHTELENHLQGKAPPAVASYQTKPPFWRSRNGIITITILATLVLGAVIGGAIGGTLGKQAVVGPTETSSASTVTAEISAGIGTTPLLTSTLHPTTTTTGASEAANI